MGSLFLRSGSLTVGTKKILFAAGAGQGLTPEGGTLAVEFRVKKNLKPEPNSCELKIWNLSPDTRKLLETPKTIPVQLDVGYGGDNHTIYLGELRSAQSEIDGPDIITTISSGDKEQNFSSNRTIFQIPKAATPAQIFTLAAKGVGAASGNVATAAAAATAGVAGLARTYHGNAAKVFGDIARANGQEWSIQDGAMQVMPIGATIGSSGSAVVLNSASGMIGSPTCDNKGVLAVKSLIQPGLFPGQPVVVQGALLQGTYRIESSEFAGATMGQEWTVMIHAKKWA